jgi:hypothetical protein
LHSESASTPTNLGDLVDVVLSYMPESIFQLVCLLPISGMKLVQKYKRVTHELARQLVAQRRDNNDDETSFVSHLCVHPIPSTRILLTFSVRDNDTTTIILPNEIPVHLRSILVAGSDTTVSPIPMPPHSFIIPPHSRTQSDSCYTTSRDCPTSNAISGPRSTVLVRRTTLIMRKCRC